MANSISTKWDKDRFRFVLTMPCPAKAATEAATLSEKLIPFLDATRVEPMAVSAIHTALEELITNLGKFGRQGAASPAESEPLVAEGQVDIDADFIEVKFIDNGCEFDPTSLDEPVFSDAPELLVPGGLGLHMLKTMFSSFIYRRADGKNIGIWRLHRNASDNHL